MGTNVVSGSAKCVVVKVADDTYFGKVAHTITSGKPKTEFQKGIENISKLLTKFMLFMIPLTFLRHNFFPVFHYYGRGKIHFSHPNFQIRMELPLHIDFLGFGISNFCFIFHGLLIDFYWVSLCSVSETNYSFGKSQTPACDGRYPRRFPANFGRRLLCLRSAAYPILPVMKAALSSHFHFCRLTHKKFQHSNHRRRLLQPEQFGILFCMNKEDLQYIIRTILLNLP